MADSEQSKKPKVGIIMGSKSDWPTMENASKILDDFGIVHECRVVSAHRTPDRLTEVAKRARADGA
ncbi:MAG: AIR carboxylase family protein, partial [Planctomycetota bacterium]